MTTNHIVRVRLEQPIYKAYAKLVALIDGGYSLTGADMQGGVIVLVFERKVEEQ